MIDLSTMLQEGGPVMYLVFAGALPLPLLGMLAGITQLGRWRFPNALLVAAPVAVVALGLMGTVLGVWLAEEVVALSSPAIAVRMAARGYAVSTYTTLFGASAAAVGCAMLAAGNALGVAIRPGDRPEFTVMGPVMGLLFGLVCLPLAAWFLGWVAGLVTLGMAFAFTFGAARFPHEKDRDRARVAGTRVLIGFYGALAYALVALLVFIWANAEYHSSVLAPAELVARVRAQALAPLTPALFTAGIMAVVSMLLGLVQASAKLGDVDGRAWVQGALFLLVPVLLLPGVGGVLWNLDGLAQQAVPWADLRRPVLAKNGIRPPRIDLEFESLTRAETMTFADTGVSWNDEPVPVGLTPGERVNLEAGPDTALSAVAKRVEVLQSAALCMTVRAHGNLSCLPFRMAGSAEAESSKGLIVDALAPEAQLVPHNKGWVLLNGQEVLGRGDLDQLAALVPPQTRVWFPPGRTVEDLITMQQLLGPEILLVWRTDPPPKIPAGSAGNNVLVIEGLPRALVVSVIRRHDRQTQYCYERALKNRPDLEGSFNVRFKIGPAGSVVAVNILDSTLNDTEVESCVESRVRRMRFPSPKGGEATVRYPYVFKKSHAP